MRIFMVGGRAREMGLPIVALCAMRKLEDKKIRIIHVCGTDGRAAARFPLFAMMRLVNTVPEKM